MSVHAAELATAVDAARLRRILDGRWARVRDQAREQLASPLFRPVQGMDLDAYRDRVAWQLRAVAETPGPSLGFPPRYGGTGDVGGWIVGFETLAWGDLSLVVKTGVQWGLFGGAVLRLGTQPHHEAYLRRIIDLDLQGCFAMTETGHGSDVQSLETTATYDPAAREFVIETPHPGARKDYIGGAARDARMAVVFAQLLTQGRSHGVHAFLVPIRTSGGEPCPGVTLEDCGYKAGLNGVDNGRIAFDRVRVPREALLNRYGDVAPDGTYSSPIESETRRFFTMLGNLVQGRVSVAGGALSATKLAQAIALRYAASRRQFHAPDGSEVVVLDYLQHQRRLLPALATTYALHFAHEDLVAAWHEASTNGASGQQGGPGGHGHRRVESTAAGLKAVTTWHATRTIQECREACGGAGYMAENQLPQLRADTDVFTTFEGDNTVLLQLVAKGLLTNYRDQFGDLDSRGTVRFVAGQVVEQVLEATAVRQLTQRLVDAVPGDRFDLLDRRVQLDLFSWRERHVIAGVARRLKRGVEAGREPFEVFDEAQDHLLLAARAHIDRQVLESFVAAVDRCVEPDTRALLQAVCDLHALSTIERDRAWYLEHGRLSPDRAKSVTRLVNELCGRLRPHARSLVDAFGIPEECITAPIAHQGRG